MIDLHLDRRDGLGEKLKALADGYDWASQKVYMTAMFKGMIEQMNVLSKEGKLSESQYEDLKTNVLGYFVLYREEIRKFREKNVGSAMTATVMHGIVDNLIETELKKSPQEIKCRKGCAHCCFQRVAVFEFEAENLQNEFNALSEERRALMKGQVGWGEDVDKWKKHYPKGKCAFLGEKNRCEVYHKRPIVCRKLYSVTYPILCDIRSDNDAAYVNIWPVEIFVSAMMNEYPMNDMAAVFEKVGFLH